jgi:bifunctional DNA-binding transcriptional regulator/antitoxin component of YhaV-PrlF toxin-antitoxin module
LNCGNYTRAVPNIWSVESLWLLPSDLPASRLISRNVDMSLDLSNQSESILKVGKKGEIFTSADLRKRANIKEGGRVKASVVGNKLVIEAAPTIEEILKRPPAIVSTTKEFEKISEDIQKEEGVYG